MDSKQTRQGHMARVSSMAFGEQALPVRFIYKTVPEHLNDTGWRMFTGYETEAFLADFDNLPPVPIEQVIKQNPTLTELLDNNAGSVWERSPNQPWQAVYDFEIPYEEAVIDTELDMENLILPIYKDTQAHSDGEKNTNAPTKEKPTKGDEIAKMMT